MTDLPLPESEIVPANPLWSMRRSDLETLTAELQAECARLRAAYLQQSKDFGYELRDPNGTIWDECRRLQAALDATLRGKYGGTASRDLPAPAAPPNRRV